MAIYILIIILAIANVVLIANTPKGHISKMSAILGWVVVISSNATCMSLKSELNNRPKQVKVTVETTVDHNGKVDTNKKIDTKWDDNR
jgi:hypothetical protein